MKQRCGKARLSLFGTQQKGQQKIKVLTTALDVTGGMRRCSFAGDRHAVYSSERINCLQGTEHVTGPHCFYEALVDWEAEYSVSFAGGGASKVGPVRKHIRADTRSDA